MSEVEAKQKIAELVEKYEQIKKSASIKKYNEAETCKEFILPLFKALGWDTESKSEVSAEEHTSAADRADYGFYLNGWPKFYLEAKKLSADLHDEKFAKQATTYSWNKGIDWAVLTDFESVKVFSAQDISEHLSHRLFFEIKYSEYLERFEQLSWLSKESFQQNVLDKEAEKVGKKLQKVSVTDALYKDLNNSRELLLKSFHNWNKDIDYRLLEEGVQKLLDRLIFIRVAEDRGLEQKTLLPMLRANGGSSSDEFFKQLVAKFRELDDIYNSNLFASHPLENWQEYDGKTAEVIESLYGRTGYYQYDFQAIPADILGSVYENYLGYKLSQSDKGMEVSKDSRKRKEQGIYYTPTYVVDYIVANALKPVLDKCESAQDLKDIKVLDPACGSGSFLIRAMEMIYQKYLEFGAQPGEMTKITILLDNIFGVDLDEQAVEIARLNLLINALGSRMKLPSLDKNIQNGNSLISGTDADLQKAFGKDYRDKKPFNWNERFPQVFDRKDPGFNVVIGNPPYVGSLELSGSGLKNDKDFYKDSFDSAIGNFDLYVLFIERSLELLRPNGQFSFIVPNKFLVNDYGLGIRKMILNKKLIRLADFSHLPIFHGAAVYPVVLVINNSEASDDSYTQVGVSNDDFTMTYQKKIQKDWLETKNSTISLDDNSEANPILQKIEAVSDQLGEVATVSSGTTGFDYQNYGKLISNTKKSNSAKFVITRNIHPYVIKWGGKINYLKTSFDSPYLELDESVVTKGRQGLYKDSNKILIRGMAKNLVAGLDSEGFALGVGTYAVTDSKIDNFLLLGLLNSKVLDFYYRTKFKSKHLAGGYLGFNAGQLKQIPIRKRGEHEAKILDEIKLLSKKMYELSHEINDQTENSNEWHSIKSEIEKTNHQIDQLVYRLYGLSPEEISLVEA